MELNETEGNICRAIIRAANHACGVVGYEGVYSTSPEISFYIDTGAMRKLKRFFDLYQLILQGKKDRIRCMLGCDADVFLKEYMSELNDGSDGVIQVEDGLKLNSRLKVELKEIAESNRVPPRILYIADCHFYHNRICHEMDKRGFAGYEEMNDHMIRQWNAKVTSKDDVYILGDFSISKPDATVRILNQLNGKLHLVIGNHDRFLEDRHYSWNGWFRSIEPYQEIRDNGRNVILSHYPVFCYKGQYRKDKVGNPLTYMLYGHVHNTQDEKLINYFISETRNTLASSRYSTEPEPIPCNMINCFCMFSDYQPMTLDEWIVIDKKRRERMVADGG